jgi:uncharacterized membrane protein YjjB (DUF3815 family)
MFKKRVGPTTVWSKFLGAFLPITIWSIYWLVAATIFFFVVTHPGWLKLVYIGLVALVAWGLAEYAEYYFSASDK